MAASYFLLRVQPQGDDPWGLSGAVEQLSTGEKRSFHTAEELIQLLGDWPASSKMQRPDAGGKPPDRGAGKGRPDGENRSIGLGNSIG